MELSDPHKGVIWDLDGVLADTADAHYRSWKESLAWWNIPFDRAAFDRVFGMNNRDTLRHLLRTEPDPGMLHDIAELKEDLFRREAQTTAKPMPGSLPLLEGLRKAGWKQALASSAPEANIDLLVDKFHIRNRFHVILSGAGMEAGKPDPALFLSAAEKLGVVAHRCVVVEDAPAGVEAARRAGMWCLAVATTRNRDDLGAASVVCNNLIQIGPAELQHLISN